MSRTKIICSIGPASASKEVFGQLIDNGLSVVRLNLSHEDNAFRKTLFDMINQVRDEKKAPIPILADTRGPEIRTREFIGEKVELITGAEVRIAQGDFDGTAERFCTTYPNLYNEVTPGTTILLDDGLLDIEVVAIDGTDIVCKVTNGGILKNRKGINIPGTTVDLPILSEFDKRDLLFAMNEGIDYVAASFIRNKADVLEVRRFLDENGGKDIHIISKIESQTGVDNLDEIIEASNGIMVARGDLGVELPAQHIPRVQKDMINRCNEAGKPVIVATQMLESMIKNPRPTRAEVSDIANSVYDGADAIMLSAESAAGSFPIDAVRTMREVVEATEEIAVYDSAFTHRAETDEQSVTNAVSYAAVTTAQHLNASCVVCPTFSGKTARLFSMFRPSIPIMAPTVNPTTYRQMNMLWGVKPVLMEEESDEHDVLFLKSVEKAKQMGLVETGDKVVISCGLPLNTKGHTNVMKVLFAK